jgi:hypothetical protein
MTQAGLLATQEAGLGASSLGWGGATTGFQGGLNATLGAEAGATTGGLLADTPSAIKAANNGMQVAGQVKSMFPKEQPIQSSPVMQPNSNPTLQSLYDGLQQNQQAEMQAIADKRAKRRELIARMGG